MSYPFWCQMNCQIIGETKPLTKVRLPVTGNLLFRTWKRRENIWTIFPWILFHSEVFPNTQEHVQQSHLTPHQNYAPQRTNFSQAPHCEVCSCTRQCLGLPPNRLHVAASLNVSITNCTIPFPLRVDATEENWAATDVHIIRFPTPMTLLYGRILFHQICGIFLVHKPKNDYTRSQNNFLGGYTAKAAIFNTYRARNLADIYSIKILSRSPTNALWFHDVILFNSDHRHVLATDVTIFQVASVRIYNFLL